MVIPSMYLVAKLSGSKGAEFEKIDSIELRGKEQNVLVYAAHSKDEDHG